MLEKLDTDSDNYQRIIKMRKKQEKEIEDKAVELNK